MIRYHATWIVPVSAPPIRDGIVACEGGVIRYVGSATGAPHGEDYDLGDAILLPGLVNTHTHLELTAMRGFLEGLAFTDWIDLLRRARTEVLTDEMLLDAARLGLLEGIHHGVTTYADTSSSGVPLRAMREIGVRGIMYQEVFGPDPAACEASLRDLTERIDRLRADVTNLVTLGVSPHAPYTVSDPLYRAVAAYARAESLPMAMHIAESADEHALVTTGEGIFADRARRRGIATPARARSPIALLEQAGCLHEDALLIHTVHLDAADVATITRTGSAVAHCPASNAKLGHGIAPLVELLEAGARVGLGSDSVASNNRMDVLDEARLATLFQQARATHPSHIPPELALELATIRGARALGLADTIGSLDPGKSADLCAFPLTNPRATPTESPAAALIFSLSGTPARFVAVAGQHLLEDGHLTLNPGTLRDRVAATGRALADWKSTQPG